MLWTYHIFWHHHCTTDHGGEYMYLISCEIVDIITNSAYITIVGQDYWRRWPTRTAPWEKRRMMYNCVSSSEYQERMYPLLIFGGKLKAVPSTLHTCILLSHKNLGTCEMKVILKAYLAEAGIIGANFCSNMKFMQNTLDTWGKVSVPNVRRVLRRTSIYQWCSSFSLKGWTAFRAELLCTFAWRMHRIRCLSDIGEE